jgi:hypothetical protein
MHSEPMNSIEIHCIPRLGPASSFRTARSVFLFARRAAPGFAKIQLVASGAGQFVRTDAAQFLDRIETLFIVL